MDIVSGPEQDTAVPRALKGGSGWQTAPAPGSPGPWNLLTGVHRNSLLLGQRGGVTGFLTRSFLELTRFSQQLERLYHEPVAAQTVTLDNPNLSHLLPAGLGT